MKLLIDNQLPGFLVDFFRERGHEAEHVLNLGMDEATDLEIWNYAIATDRWVLSKDEDFVILANRPGDQGRLIWIRLGNCRNAALRSRLELELPTLLMAESSGQRIVVIR